MSQTTRYRYIIHGQPSNRMYMVEEARWEDQTSQFNEEQVNMITPTVVKKLIGYMPTTVGEQEIVMWLYIPNPLQQSPLKKLLEAQDYDLEKWRYFPSKGMNVLEQSKLLPMNN